MYEIKIFNLYLINRMKPNSTIQFSIIKVPLLFSFLSVVSFLFFHYYNFFNIAPQSLHVWRQSDCLAFTLNYFEGQSFFQPRVFNYLNDNGYCAGECPLIYFIVGKLWQLTGVQYWIFKGIQLLIFYAGAWALLKINLIFNPSKFFAFVILGIYYSSPLIMIYAPSYLADVPSLSFTWLGLYYFLTYQTSEKKLYLILSPICFLIAMLLKANAMFLPIAIVIVLMLSKLKWMKENKLFNFNYSIFFGLILAIICQHLWYKWVIYYTEIHQSSFLGTGTWPGWPYWEANKDNISSTWEMLSNYRSDLFNPAIWSLFIMGFLYSIYACIKRESLALLIVLLTIASLSFIAYFFVGFRDNNYYFVNLYTLPFLVLMYLFQQVNVFKVKRLISYVCISLFIYNFAFAQNKMNEYYIHDSSHQAFDRVYYSKSFREFIDEHLAPTCQLISFPDVTPNGTLSLIRRHGVSQYGFKEGKINEEDLQLMLQRNIRYYLCNNDYGLNDSILQSHIDTLLGSIETIKLFKLK